MDGSHLGLYSLRSRIIIYWSWLHEYVCFRMWQPYLICVSLACKNLCTLHVCPLFMVPINNKNGTCCKVLLWDCLLLFLNQWHVATEACRRNWHIRMASCVMINPIRDPYKISHLVHCPPCSLFSFLFNKLWFINKTIICLQQNLINKSKSHQIFIMVQVRDNWAKWYPCRGKKPIRPNKLGKPKLCGHVGPICLFVTWPSHHHKQKRKVRTKNINK